MTGVKMMTCCYCGARDVMRMGKGARVALSCLSCGAPVLKFEAMKPAEAPPPRAPLPERINRHQRRAPHEALLTRKRKKRSSLVERIWDKVEDVFDLDDLLDWD